MFEVEGSINHITLLISEGQEARSLGVMCKAFQNVQDKETFKKGVTYSVSLDTYGIDLTVETGVEWEEVERTRTHGRELSDSNLILDRLDEVPSGLWASGPFDIGKLDIQPVTLNFTMW